MKPVTTEPVGLMGHATQRVTCTVPAPYAPGRGRAWIESNDALKMPKVLLAIIAAGVVVLIAVLVVAAFSL